MVSIKFIKIIKTLSSIDLKYACHKVSIVALVTYYSANWEICHILWAKIKEIEERKAD